MSGNNRPSGILSIIGSQFDAFIQQPTKLNCFVYIMLELEHHYSNYSYQTHHSYDVTTIIVIAVQTIDFDLVP